MPSVNRLISSFHTQPPLSSPSSSTDSSTSLESSFFETRSRVVCFTTSSLELICEIFPEAIMFEIDGRLFGVFRGHEEACAALSLSTPAVSVVPALQTDLEPFHDLNRFLLNPTPSHSSSPFSPIDQLPRTQMLRMSSSYPDFHNSPIDVSASKAEYTLSTNPPNPKNSFRLGDWICSSPTCAAHNFGRNLSCIGCGCPRTNSGNNLVSGGQTGQGSLRISTSGLGMPNTRVLPSPRFSAVQGTTTYYSSSSPSQQQQQQHPQISQFPNNNARTSYPSPAPSSHMSISSGGGASNSGVAAGGKTGNGTTHPLLTPSGRAFATGGKVQNISSDPLSPCIMYWPDNEPFPEQGQIRPSGLVGVPPPILNTGNRGPISHQPGDWICQKCNYLNWRRRKVCQTCLPYAEGNGDSISTAVQAERIALLTSVLAQTQISSGTLEIVPPNNPTNPHVNVSAHVNLSQPSPHLSSTNPVSMGSTSSRTSSRVADEASTTSHAVRSHSLTPPQIQRPFIDLSPSRAHAQAQALGQANKSVYKSHSHLQLGSLYGDQAHLSPNLQQPQQQPQQQRRMHHSQSQQQMRLPPTMFGRNPSPIYQTSRRREDVYVQQRDETPLYSTGGVHIGIGGGDINKGLLTPTTTTTPFLHAPTPSPLLPSFLQDIVQSPALSPTTTTSSSSSVDDFEEVGRVVSPLRDSFQFQNQHQHSQQQQVQGQGRGVIGDVGRYSSGGFGGVNRSSAIGSGRSRGSSGDSLSSAGSRNSTGPGTGTGAPANKAAMNIWRLDGEESKSLSAFPLPNHQELVQQQQQQQQSQQLQQQPQLGVGMNSLRGELRVGGNC